MSNLCHILRAQRSQGQRPDSFSTVSNKRSNMQLMEFRCLLTNFEAFYSSKDRPFIMNGFYGCHEFFLNLEISRSSSVWL